MDRDKRWERVKIAYDGLVNGISTKSDNLVDSISQSYEQGTTDEFIKPLINSKVENGKIENDDVVICFNFRTDRCREITEVLTQQDMLELGMKKLNLHYTTMTQYDQSFKGVPVIFENNDLKSTLGVILAANGKTQLRMA